MAEDFDSAAEGADADKPEAAKLTKKQLIEAAAAETGQKKSAVKEIVDAVLGELGQALSRGDALVLPPLGRMTVARRKEAERNEVLVLKLRRAKATAATAITPEVDDDEA